MKASVLIAGDAVVKEGDFLAHVGDGTSRPIGNEKFSSPLSSQTLRPFLSEAADAICVTSQPLQSGQPVQIENAPSWNILPANAHARVIDPTPGERDANGHYRVRCEIFPKHTFQRRAA